MTAKPAMRVLDGITAGIHSIDHFGLQMPDLAAMQSFLQKFGLKPQSDDTGALQVRANGEEHIWARILPGPAKKMLFMSFNCFAQDFEAIRQQVTAAGADFIDPPAGGSDDGFWFADPDGIALQVKVGPNLQPDAKRPLASLDVPPGVQGAAYRSNAPHVGPSRLAHIALFVSDINASLDFYMRTLGVYLADRSADVIAFTYGRHGCDHHLVAMVQSDAGGLHHCSWEVNDVEHLGLIGEQVRAGGHTNQWGVGRHVLGSNWFNYIEAPGGGWWEASFNIDYIPKDWEWATKDHPVEDSFYLWGPDVPETFVINSEGSQPA